MVSTTAAAEVALGPGRVLSIWARHLTSLAIPALSLVFLWTGPHPWYVAILFMWPMVVLHQVDCAAWRERRQPAAELPAWPFDVLVYVLVALQLVIVAATVQLYTQQAIFSVDSVLVLLLIGGSSGFSIITAHELIHRKGRVQQTLGRMLLCSVLYEHFYTEHLRGHHVRVGTPEDPATARFGESFEPFFRRTVPAQLRSAWRLECRRLGDPEMRAFDPRQRGNRVLHGLLVESVIVVAIAVTFGWPSLFAFVLQAFMAVRLLEAVNYFEHWGLQRRSARVSPADSWDTHSWFTYYGLVGLSRHADHHAWPARPYQQLRVFEEAPLLPMGYVGLVDLVTARNAAFQELATDELARLRLGPFADEATPASDPRAVLARAREEERGPRREPGPLRRRWRALPGLARVGGVLAALVLFTALGVQIESGAGLAGLGGRLVLHAWIVAVVGAVLSLGVFLRSLWDHESFAFGLAFLLLIGLGRLTETLFPLL